MRGLTNMRGLPDRPAGYARLKRTRPECAAGRVPYEAPVHVISDSSGPNERKIETLPALAVGRLSITEAYRVGRAVHFIGFVLDQETAC
jgi:hypothetical protein